MHFNEKYLKQGLRILLGLVFVVSALTKLVGPVSFIHAIGKINFFASSTDSVFAYIFIIFELSVGVLLIIKYHHMTLIIASLMLIVFSCYLGFKLITNDTSDCGCFGDLLPQSNLISLSKNFILLIMAVYIYE
ncbi:DoxX family membrane protein [bacterium]|nr:DoxX family membrane protein [bacterium]